MTSICQGVSHKHGACVAGSRFTRNILVQHKEDSISWDSH